jgi:hypothetical protein
MRFLRVGAVVAALALVSCGGTKKVNEACTMDARIGTDDCAAGLRCWKLGSCATQFCAGTCRRYCQTETDCPGGCTCEHLELGAPGLCAGGPEC